MCLKKFIIGLRNTCVREQRELKGSLQPDTEGSEAEVASEI